MSQKSPSSSATGTSITIIACFMRENQFIWLLQVLIINIKCVEELLNFHKPFQFAFDNSVLDIIRAHFSDQNVASQSFQFQQTNYRAQAAASETKCTSSTNLCLPHDTRLSKNVKNLRRADVPSAALLALITCHCSSANPSLFFTVMRLKHPNTSKSKFQPSESNSDMRDATTAAQHASNSGATIHTLTP